jgi:hypothetical protein
MSCNRPILLGFMRLSLKRWQVVLLSLTMIQLCHAQQKTDRIKVDHGLLITWDRTSRDVNATQIHLAKMADDPTHPFVSLNVLRLVPQAMGVTVYDVAARGDLIAVAAIFKNKDAIVRPTGALMLFNLKAISKRHWRWHQPIQSLSWRLMTIRIYGVSPMGLPTT